MKQIIIFILLGLVVLLTIYGIYVGLKQRGEND